MLHHFSIDQGHIPFGHGVQGQAPLEAVQDGGAGFLPGVEVLLEDGGLRPLDHPLDGGPAGTAGLLQELLRHLHGVDPLLLGGPLADPDEDP